jgi:hypothetical protein
MDECIQKNTEIYSLKVHTRHKATRAHKINDHRLCFYTSGRVGQYETTSILMFPNAPTSLDAWTSAASQFPLNDLIAMHFFSACHICFSPFFCADGPINHSKRNFPRMTALTAAAVCAKKKQKQHTKYALRCASFSSPKSEK